MVVSTRAVDCLERLVSEMTCYWYVSSMTYNYSVTSLISVCLRQMCCMCILLCGFQCIKIYIHSDVFVCVCVIQSFPSFQLGYVIF